jgi:Flp pilus assembly pilin Flp
VPLIHLLPLLTSLRRARDRILVRLDHPPSGTGPAAARGIGGLGRFGRFGRFGCDGEAGQATVEYALMLLGAAVIAIALLTWATSSGRIGDLFDAVFDELQSRM